MSAVPSPHSVPQRAIREPLAVIHEYAMIGAGHVARRREEVLTAENEVIEQYARLEEQFETLNTAAREWLEMCDRDDNPAYPAATLQEVDRLHKALRDAVSFPTKEPS